MKISTFLAAMVAVTLSLGSPLSLITRQIDLPGAFSSINKTTRVELAASQPCTLAAKAFTACTSLVTNETQNLANSEIVHSCLCNDTNLEPELRCYVTHFYECIYSIQDLLIKPPFNLTYPPSPFAGLIQSSTDFFCGNNTLYYDLFGWTGDLFDLSFEWGFPLDLPLATLSNTTGGLFPGADLPWPVGGAHGIVLEPSVESVNEKRDVSPFVTSPLALDTRQFVPPGFRNPLNASTIACAESDSCILAAQAFAACTNLVNQSTNWNSTNAASVSTTVASCLCNDTRLNDELECYATRLNECNLCVSNLLFPNGVGGNASIQDFVVGESQYLTESFCSHPDYDLWAWTQDIFTMASSEEWPITLPLATLVNLTEHYYDLPWPVGQQNGIIITASPFGQIGGRDIIDTRDDGSSDSGNGPACAESSACTIAYDKWTECINVQASDADYDTFVESCLCSSSPNFVASAWSCFACISSPPQALVAHFPLYLDGYCSTPHDNVVSFAQSVFEFGQAQNFPLALPMMILAEHVTAADFPKGYPSLELRQVESRNITQEDPACCAQSPSCVFAADAWKSCINQNITEPEYDNMVRACLCRSNEPPITFAGPYTVNAQDCFDCIPDADPTLAHWAPIYLQQYCNGSVSLDNMTNEVYGLSVLVEFPLALPYMILQKDVVPEDFPHPFNHAPAALDMRKRSGTN